MVKEELRTEGAPQAIGPYSQGVRIGRFLFVSGQIPIEPSTGQVIEGDIAAQTRQVLKNIQAVLASGGASLKDCMKMTVFMTDLMQFAEMNSVYGEFFKEPYPARATVEVSALPKGVGVEIDAVAVIGDDV